MSDFEILTNTTTVTVLFAGDQPVARAPSLPEIGRSFAETFHFGSLSLSSTESGSQLSGWQAEKGEFKTGDRVALIDSCRGSLTDLSVTVADVDTKMAEKVLRELWGTLGRLARQHLSANITSVSLENLGTMVFESVATVKADKTFAELFPLAGTLRSEVLKKLEGPVKPFDEPMFRMAIDIPLTLGRRLVNRRIILEPRYYAQDRDKVFFTRTPLRSEQHAELLKKIFG